MKQKPILSHATKGQVTLRSAFSLVELITVIAVIALLVAFLMPALSQAREQANQAQCLSNLRNLGQAALMHVPEHAGYFPTAGWQWHCENGDTCDPTGLQDPAAKKYDYYLDNGIKRPVPVTVALADYMGVHCRTDSREHLESDLLRSDLRRLFHCPSQAVEYHAWTQRGDGGAWTAPEEYSSYGFNEALLGRRGYNTELSPKANASRLKESASVFFALDARPRDERGNRAFLIPDNQMSENLYDVQQFLLTFEPNRGREALDFMRHRMRINVLFCDGHAAGFAMGLGPNGGGELREIYVSRGISY
jgi:prepilin-type processing-associated H-X9-DG protein/prepilin-type N-terminal cleavage/methylation domain-containing protein